MILLLAGDALRPSRVGELLRAPLLGHCAKMITLQLLLYSYRASASFLRAPLLGHCAKTITLQLLLYGHRALMIFLQARLLGQS
eukprot:845141-Alexandrium_andersonii.AAC.1